MTICYNCLFWKRCNLPARYSFIDTRCLFWVLVKLSGSVGIANSLALSHESEVFHDVQQYFKVEPWLNQWVY